METKTRSEDKTDDSNNQYKIKKRNLNELSETFLEAIKQEKYFKNVQTILLKLIQEFPTLITEQKLLYIDEELEDYEEFGEKRYGILLNETLNLTGLTDCILIDNLFICEGCSINMFKESLFVLLDSVKHATWPSKKLDLLISLVVKLCTSDCFLTVLLRACFHYEKTIGNANNINLWEQLCQIITTIPERIANKTKGKIPDELKLENFAQNLFLQIAKCLGIISQAPIHINTKPISIMLSYCSNFTKYDSAKQFIRLLSIWAEKREKFNDILHIIIKEINQKGIEAFAILILQSANDPKYFFNNSLITNQYWNYILCKKLPFLTYSIDDLISSNLVKYLSTTDKLEEILVDLVKIWSDKSALTHTAFEQHLYITKLIILTFKLIPERITKNVNIKSKIISYLLEGISVHLDSTVENIRALGMATGEIIMNILNNDSENELKFDYTNIKPEQEEIVNLLKSFDFVENTINISEDDAFDELNKISVYSNKNLKLKVKIERNLNKEFNDDKTINENELLDSDDEFEPYDTSNDVKQSVKKRPKYLRDLIEGLLEQKDPEIFSESLQCSEELICKQLPDDDISIGLELMHILCCLDEHFYCENFDELKFNASLAILLINPKETAEFLCCQFHSPNHKYSICQKLIFLELLSSGATTLSKTGAVDTKLSKFKHVDEKTKDADKLKSLIKSKIIGKTRKINSATKISKSYENQFSKVAGSFFFPLIRGKDSGIEILYKPSGLRDNTTLLLVSLLKTLAIIITSSVNLGQLVVRMSQELFEAIWNLRYHNEVKVREAVIHCIAAIVLSVPEVALLNSDLFLDLLEARQWLIDLVSSDLNNAEIDENLKMFAAQVVLFIDQNVSLEKLLKNALL